MQKMKRKYIICEQLDKHLNIGIRRLQKVIDGEQSGISKKNNWKGGGSFVYCELKENNQELVNEIIKATKDNINTIKKKIYDDERIIPYITKNDLISADEEFEAMENLDDKKKALLSIIDKNKLYVNYSDIDDETYNISNEDKKLTVSFYEEK